MSFARSMMTMRAIVERRQPDGRDDMNQIIKGTYEDYDTIPCWLWSKAKKSVFDNKKVAVYEETRCMVPADSDITQDDRIRLVKDRREKVLFDGPLKIEAIVNRRSHKEIILETVKDGS